uniref:Uncharacterized protein n=1 Tax=Quercus lobata TaxID=97700 RepID=A0A7N2LBT1_QUELO
MLWGSFNWVESSSCDGFAFECRLYGPGFLQVYAEGPAQPIGGVAAIAILIGPDAPITFESTVRGTYLAHAYDFYKPNLASEYSAPFLCRILQLRYAIQSKRPLRVWKEKTEREAVMSLCQQQL